MSVLDDTTDRHIIVMNGTTVQYWIMVQTSTVLDFTVSDGTMLIFTVMKVLFSNQVTAKGKCTVPTTSAELQNKRDRRMSSTSHCVDLVMKEY